MAFKAPPKIKVFRLCFESKDSFCYTAQPLNDTKNHVTSLFLPFSLFFPFPSLLSLRFKSTQDEAKKHHTKVKWPKNDQKSPAAPLSKVTSCQKVKLSAKLKVSRNKNNQKSGKKEFLRSFSWSVIYQGVNVVFLCL